MKTKWLIAMVTLWGCVFVGCNSKEEQNLLRGEDSVLDENIRPLEEALRSADRLYEQLYGPDTRSIQRKVASLNVFKPKLTRAEVVDPGFYIVNYEGNNGFVILSTDMRMDPVYAISNEGSLHMEDTLQNQGLSWYMNQYLMSATIVGLDTTKHELNGPSDEMFTIVRYRKLSKFEKFHQKFPYNRYCFTSSGRQALVGCGPLAVGTVLGYFNWPQRYGEVEFDWSGMTGNIEHDDWAKLFKLCGDPDNMNAFYGEKSTGTFNANSCYERTFKNMGYKNTSMEPLDISQLAEWFKITDAPLICMGDTPSISHVWVLDGYTIGTMVFPMGNKKETHYLHCNWGWGGKANGYYVFSDDILGHIQNTLDEGEKGTSYPFTELEVVYGYKINN